MQFAPSFSRREKRLVLDERSHGELLSVIDADDWRAARQKAESDPATGQYRNVPGHGWQRIRAIG